MIRRIDAATVAEAVEVLRGGGPVVLPLPSPAGYVVTATTGPVVNTTKGRAADQPVGLSVRDLDVLDRHLAVTETATAQLRWLVGSETVSVLVPVADPVPDWLAPAVRDGWVFFTAAPWRPDLAEILTAFGWVFMSSANATGGATAVTATQAAAAFGDDVLVLDGDAERDPARQHGSTTMLRVGSTGDIEVARSGIHDAAFAGPDAYAEDLRLRWDALSSTP
ncbi:Sua5/YciO/YrdC/YwlC family protein [Actinomycetospora endophytica]|uniref:Sua5/YciO/YrdC/YwlC family protein n=1 Tax=Actinomycetospora endophytica TaxID=2291215 RepID=A0ABS8P181_9PSEU|nr:Sua5/YciO/YrdC/YwlC family protein [Actinomycetospora endophytica]MCD2191991.1 Sua5/YciO/YrdC/YwlC family protein [Actinomycetospora endophytica]